MSRSSQKPKPKVDPSVWIRTDGSTYRVGDKLPDGRVVLEVINNIGIVSKLPKGTK